MPLTVRLTRHNYTSRRESIADAGRGICTYEVSVRTRPSKFRCAPITRAQLHTPPREHRGRRGDICTLEVSVQTQPVRASHRAATGLADAGEARCTFSNRCKVARQKNG